MIKILQGEKMLNWIEDKSGWPRFRSEDEKLVFEIYYTIFPGYKRKYWELVVRLKDKPIPPETDRLLATRNKTIKLAKENAESICKTYRNVVINLDLLRSDQEK